jgi:hypothetical protein
MDTGKRSSYAADDLLFSVRPDSLKMANRRFKPHTTGFPPIKRAPQARYPDPSGYFADHLGHYWGSVGVPSLGAP